MEVAASNGMPQTTVDAPFRFLVNFRRMKESVPAWVGSVAAEVREEAVNAWSMVFPGMRQSPF
ncbi:hypothetical protein D3C80_1788690 [compost metagenome]